MGVVIDTSKVILMMTDWVLNMLIDVDDDHKQIATRLVESDMMEVLMAVSKLDDPQRKEASKIAEKTLKKAEEWGLVQHVGDAKWWRQLWGMMPLPLPIYGRFGV